MALKRIPSVLRLAVVAAVLALALMTTGDRETPAAAELRVASGSTFSMSNSKEGQAILSAAKIGPGASVSETVTVANTGSIPGDFTLSQTGLSDTRGLGGGALSAALDLHVEDVTGTPATVFAGKLAGAGPASPGRLRRGRVTQVPIHGQLPARRAGRQRADGGRAEYRLPLDRHR
jgi:hypothetical protein